MMLAETQKMQARAWADTADDKASGDGLASSASSMMNLLGLMQNLHQPDGGNAVPAAKAVDNYRVAEPKSDANAIPVPKAEARLEKSIAAKVEDAADQHGIPRTLFLKLIRRESSFDPLAMSRKGAMGLGQLMPGTARELGLRIGSAEDVKDGSVWNADSNLEASARYLKRLHNHFTGRGATADQSWALASASYNAGIGNIEKALKLAGDGGLRWDRVVAALPRITGSASRETIDYVASLTG